jgi:hypothetical protein
MYIAKNPTKSEVSRQVPGAGLEPARYCYQRILSPFHHPRETCFLQNYIELFMRLVLSSPCNYYLTVSIIIALCMSGITCVVTICITTTAAATRPTASTTTIISTAAAAT